MSAITTSPTGTLSHLVPPPKDIPRTSQQSFILVACCQWTGSGHYTTPIPWTAYNAVQLAPVVTCATGFASVTTGNILSNDVLRITTQWDEGSNTVSFGVLIGTTNASFRGECSFSCTTKGKRETITNADGEEEEVEVIAPATVDFTFQVVMYGQCHPKAIGQEVMYFKVGDVVDVQIAPTLGNGNTYLNSISPYSGQVRHWRDGYIRKWTDEDSAGNPVYRKEFVGYSSGIFISAVWGQDVNGYDVPRATLLQGIAKRPGVYPISMYYSMNSDLGGAGRLGVGNGSEVLLISIRDGDFNEFDGNAEGTPVIACDCKYDPDRNDVRVTAYTGRSDNAAGIVGVHEGGGMTWTRRVRWPYSTLPTWYETQIVHDLDNSDPDNPVDNGWYIQSRSEIRGTWGDTIYSGWIRLTDNPRKGYTAPPNTGWSEGHTYLCGCTEFEIPGKGFFDWKGKTKYTIGPVGEKQEVEFDWWEQQPRCHPQYDTEPLSSQEGSSFELTGNKWENPPAVRNGDGLRYWFYIPSDKLAEPEGVDYGKWVLTPWDATDDSESIAHEARKPINNTILIPYSPPTCEKYGDEVVRDLVVAIPNKGYEIVLNGSSSDFQGAVIINNPPEQGGSTIHGIIPYHQAHRAIIPLNGTSGDREYKSAANVSIEKWQETNNVIYGETAEFLITDSAYRQNRRYSLSAGFDAVLALQKMNGPVVSKIYDLLHDGLDIEFSYKNNISDISKRIMKFGDVWDTYTIEEITTGEPTGESSGSFLAEYILGSGCSTKGDKRHSSYLTSKIRGDGTCAYIDRTIKSTTASDDGTIIVEKWTTPGNVSVGGESSVAALLQVNPDFNYFGGTSRQVEETAVKSCSLSSSVILLNPNPTEENDMMYCYDFTANIAYSGTVFTISGIPQIIDNAHGFTTVDAVAVIEYKGIKSEVFSMKSAYDDPTGEIYEKTLLELSLKQPPVPPVDYVFHRDRYMMLESSSGSKYTFG